MLAACRRQGHVSGQFYSYRLDRMIEDYQNAGIQDCWHHWDARLKLFLLVIAIGLNVVVADAWLSAGLLAVSLVFIVRSKIPFRLFAIFFLAPAWATLLVFVGFSVGFGLQPILSVGPVTFYREGVALGVSAALRVASEMSWIAALMLTTPFPRLLDALQFYRLRGADRRLRDGLSLRVSVSRRMLPDDRRLPRPRRPQQLLPQDRKLGDDRGAGHHPCL